MLRKAAWLLASMVILLSSVAAAAETSANNNLLVAADTKASGEYAFTQCRALQGKPFDTSSTKKKALIVGDSYGCDFLNKPFIPASSTTFGSGDMVAQLR